MASAANAADVTLEWGPSPTVWAQGYKIHYGIASGGYSTIVDVGKVLTATIPGLAADGTTYYFAATTYGVSPKSGLLEESVYSNQVFKQFGKPPPPKCPCSIFSTGEAPTQQPDADANPVTLGLKFTPSANGQISAIRFYAAAAGTGNNIYGLWTQSGTLIASKTVARPAASGWTTVTFNAPVAVTAGQEYTASVWLSKSTYYGDDQGFDSSRTVGPLTAPVGAGRYAYSAAPQFPTELYLNENYWVDVVFSSGSAPVMPAPTNLRLQ